MIWLTWRQFRLPAAAVAVIVVALSLVLVILQLPSYTDAKTLFNQITDFDYTLYYGGLLVMYAIPPIIGMFWGAPLITRELETGTHRLVWNQTVTRGRWLAAKLGMAGLAAMAVSALASLAVSWWASPIDTATETATNNSFSSRIEPVIFGVRGIVPIGYAAFAFVLGVTVGILLRRTIAAMAVTLAVYIAVQLAFPAAVRPYIVSPEQQTVAISEETINQIRVSESGKFEELGIASIPGSWLLSNQTVDAAGKPVALATAVNTPECTVPPPSEGVPPRQGPGPCLRTLASLGYQQQVTFHPLSKFWALQAIETAFYLALTALLTWLCFRLVRRHLS